MTNQVIKTGFIYKNLLSKLLIILPFVEVIINCTIIISI